MLQIKLYLHIYTISIKLLQNYVTRIKILGCPLLCWGGPLHETNHKGVFHGPKTKIGIYNRMVWDGLVQFGMSWDCFRWCGTVWDGLVLEQDSLGCGIPNKGQFNMLFAVQKSFLSLMNL